MRHSRRGGQGGLEFGGSGEDSFVAVVVTKLTGALLFILLLTMVIMALIPRATDKSARERSESAARSRLEITTPGTLPEAIVGRPYAVALAASGANGPVRWSITGTLPDGLTFDTVAGQLEGTPRQGTARPVEIVAAVRDDSDRASRPMRLVVFQPDHPLTTPSRWAPRIPPVPVRAWFEQGFGFLVVLLVHMVGMNTLTSLERDRGEENPSARRRFFAYRTIVRLATLAAVVALAAWIVWHRSA